MACVLCFVCFLSFPFALRHKEMRELVPPIMNEKVVSITARMGDPVVVPCVAYANPKPVYR